MAPRKLADTGSGDPTPRVPSSARCGGLRIGRTPPPAYNKEPGQSEGRELAQPGMIGRPCHEGLILVGRIGGATAEPKRPLANPPRTTQQGPEVQGTTVYFDLETGGIEAHQPNIQIAAIAVRDGVEVAAFEHKIRFDDSVADPEALAINHYDAAVWADQAVTSETAVRAFSRFCRDHADLELLSKRTGRPYSVARLAGHNIVSFDIPRLRRMFDESTDSYLPACWWYPLDTYQRAIWHFAERDIPTPENYKLSTLAAHFGLDAEGAHDALADVRLSAGVAHAIARHQPQGKTPASLGEA